MTSYRSYSHSVKFFRPVKAIVRTDEANSMAFLQREFLPSNDTYKTKTSAGNTLHFIRGNENVTHSAQGETVFLGRDFLFRISEYTQRGRKCSFRKQQIFISQTTDFHFANYRFPFRKLQIFISQTTDSHFANYRFPFRKLQISISQTTDSHFANYRFPFPFRFVPFRFANYSKPTFNCCFKTHLFCSNYFIVECSCYFLMYNTYSMPLMSKNRTNNQRLNSLEKQKDRNHMLICTQ